MVEGPCLVDLKLIGDNRGSFLKVFSHETLPVPFPMEVKEIYLSTSQKNVIRGMHFQKPPFDHHKIVVCLSGKVLDVVVDVRKDSQEYGRYW